MVSTEWSRTTKRLIVVGLLIIVLLLLYVFRSLLPPIIIAIVLAYILKPFVDAIEQRTKLSRTLAVILVFLVLLIFISIIPVTIVPWAVERVNWLNRNAQQLIDQLVVFLSQPFFILDYEFNLAELMGDVRGSLQNILGPFATQSVNLLINVASSLLWTLSIFVISFYLVKDADRFRGFLDRLSPPSYTEEMRRLREEINKVWKAFFRGQVLLGVVIGMAVWIAMTIVGLPNAGLMGLLAGLLEVIPSFGPILATIPALLIALIQGSTYLPLSNFGFMLLVLAIYVVIQQMENAYLVPRILGRRLQLHPVMVFIGVLAGGFVAGTIGILLAAPVIATFRVVFLYIHAKLLNEAPFPPEMETGEIYPGEIDAILFDLDGTLIETDDDAVETLARRLAPFRKLLPGRDPHRAARHILMALEGPANSFLTVLDRLGLDDNFLAMADRVGQLRGLSTPANFRPVEGTQEMLRDLSYRYHLGIVTTRSHLQAEAFLEQEGLTDLFQVVTGREDTFRIKPHPSPIRHAAEELGVPVERCLMVGDTQVDMWAARAAGARAVGVLCGFGSENELERAGANLVVKTTAQLRDWM
jgi:HAD superfamily hydrolase (TIGR01549 family)